MLILLGFADIILESSKRLLDPPSHKKFSGTHHRFAVEPDVEIAADAVDVRLRRSVSAGVIRVRMSEGNVNAGNFFVLQNISDDMRASGVGANGEFTDPITVFVGAGVGAEFLEQLLVVAGKIDNPIVAHFDRQRKILEIAVFAAEIVADHAVDDKNAVGVCRRSKNLAARKVTPFCGSNDPAGLEPF